MDPYIFKVGQLKVKDGDTFSCVVDLGFGITYKINVRMSDIDTPETWRPSSLLEKTAGEHCTDYLKGIVSEDPNREFYIKSYGLGIYGRYVCDLFYKVGTDFISVNNLVQTFMVETHQLKSDVQ